MLSKTNDLQKGDILQNDEEFLVPCESDKSMVYIVNIKLGLCSCKDGLYGKFCKHQCAVCKFFGVDSINFPPTTPTDRHFIAHFALGDKTPSLAFYNDFVMEKAYPYKMLVLVKILLFLKIILVQK